MSFLSSLLRRFTRDEKGSLVFDAVIVMPMLAWGYMGMFVYWDAYRATNAVQKASYTIADLISRSQDGDGINDAYIAGMRTTFNRMLNARNPGNIRLTSYTWSGVRDRYEVIFSRSPGRGMPVLTNADLASLTDQLPIMADGDSAILLETEFFYVPPVNYGLDHNLMEQFIVTRPRFLPKLCHENFAC
ncbi:TadE/TadG family type IV pilus assembly protein [Pseudorhodobacter ferrugineus]|uniref:TadE/TadG family type IV pilus assembly protein n=1 Tax=Pseudorhodobacter ferrugineus TaxID=77008 RepID=UPI0003B6715D|nr:hypothetical protein [Pseudorhodobacter ferrugineus]